MEGRAPGTIRPSLDPLSPVFNPLQALQPEVEKQVSLPFPAVRACDSLDAYQSLVQGKAIRRRLSGHEKPATVRDTRHTSSGSPSTSIQGCGPQVLADQRELLCSGQIPAAQVTGDSGAVSQKGQAFSVAVMTSEPSNARKKKTRTVLNVMEGEVEGPVRLLQECLRNKTRVRVVIRHCAGVRGKCEGFILAFDKHWNLVLGDVEEEYIPFTPGGVQEGHGMRKRRRRRRRRKRRKEGLLEQQEDQEAPPVGGREPDETPVLVVQEQEGNHNKEMMHRHVHQLFIRGDNIVLVQCIRDHLHPKL